MNIVFEHTYNAIEAYPRCGVRLVMALGAANGGVPLVPLPLFKSRSFVAGMLSIFLIQFFFAAILPTLAFYSQEGLYYLPWQSGLVVIVMGIAFLLASSISAKVERRLNTNQTHAFVLLVLVSVLASVSLSFTAFLFPKHGKPSRKQ